MINVYMDETGRTGRHIYRDGKWNYHNNSYFGLGGVAISDKYENYLQGDVKEAIEENKIQGELKYSKKNVKKVALKLLPQFFRLLEKYDARLYFEIVKQKFCDCMWITEYLIFPYYDTNTIEINERIFATKLFANYVYKNISDEIIWKCIETLDGNNYDKVQLVDCCELLKKDVFLHEMVEETIDSIQKLPLPDSIFFPMKDFFKNGTSHFAISPHIDSFNNIITRARLDAHDDTINVIHDEENELMDALKIWGEKRGITIEFKKSKIDYNLQLIDFLVGYIVQSIISCIEKREEDTLNIFRYINFVSTVEEQLLFQPNENKLRQIKQLLDGEFSRD